MGKGVSWVPRYAARALWSIQVGLEGPSRMPHATGGTGAEFAEFAIGALLLRRVSDSIPQLPNTLPGPAPLPFPTSSSVLNYDRSRTCHEATAGIPLISLLLTTPTHPSHHTLAPPVWASCTSTIDYRERPCRSLLSRPGPTRTLQTVQPRLRGSRRLYNPSSAVNMQYV